MNNNKKTIVVTGGNKGIGFALVESLAKDSRWHVILAARNPQFAQDALGKIKSQNPDADVIFEQLDVSNF